jgi:DNA-binding CsgD family transcriptional regulator
MAGGARALRASPPLMDWESIDQVRETAEPSWPMWDCACEVSRGTARPGIVQSVRFLDPRLDPSRFVGRYAAELFAPMGFPDPEACVRALLEARDVTIVRVGLRRADGWFCVLSARASDDRTARAVVRCLEARLLPELFDAKVARVAEGHGLSDRERQVLHLLLRGHRVEDIAAMLDIAPRTVKFHQANVLQKLGADSRMDLLRVLL